MAMASKETEQEAALQRIRHRAKAIEMWLQKNGGAALDEQRHLDTGSRERAYWHYGYMVALRDVLRLISGQSPSLEDQEPEGTPDTLRLTH